MTDLSDMTNTPLTMEVAGKKLKVRRPELQAIHATLESKIKSDAQQEAKTMAEMNGLEGDDKISFLSRAFKDLPKGADLQAMVYDAIGTIDGFRLILKAALKEDQPEITDRDIDLLIMADPEVAGEWAVYLCGYSGKVPQASKDKEAPQQ
jgi:hypothetical protein